MVEEDRVVCMRFGHDYDSDCMAMDETLYAVSEKVQNFCVIYLGESISWKRRCRVQRTIGIANPKTRSKGNLS